MSILYQVESLDNLCTFLKFDFYFQNKQPTVSYCYNFQMIVRDCYREIKPLETVLCYIKQISIKKSICLNVHNLCLRSKEDDLDHAAQCIVLLLWTTLTFPFSLNLTCLISILITLNLFSFMPTRPVNVVENSGKLAYIYSSKMHNFWITIVKINHDMTPKGKNQKLMITIWWMAWEFSENLATIFRESRFPIFFHFFVTNIFCNL